MSEHFRFPRAPNHADRIQWRPWGQDAFDEAAREDRPLLLNLTAVWCQFCREMDETTFSDPDVIQILNDRLVPVRVDADRHPEVQDRYIAGGWPTNAFLTPTGEVLWVGTFLPVGELLGVARSVLGAWGSKRDELELEVGRRRRALEAARSRRPAMGLVRRDAAEDVLNGVRASYDQRNGGFGQAPKFPYPDAMELLVAHAARSGDVTWREMAVRTLDGMVAGELCDNVEGGFFRYALAEDWTQPRHEKLLATCAGLVRDYALGARLEGRADWRELAERGVAWVDATLRRDDGFWGGSQAADETYFSAGAQERAGMPAPRIDRSIYTSAVASWIRTLAEAGAGLGRAAWVDAAAAAFPRLLERMRAGNGLLHHYEDEDEPTPAVPGLLVDALEAARAGVALNQVTGNAAALETAAALAHAIERHLWADGGGFLDRAHEAGESGALRYRDMPFEANAQAARLLLDLHHATGERSWRALAERVLATLSPLAGRHEVAGAAFALGVEEYFQPPPAFVLIGEGEAAAALRAAALALPLPARRLWTLPSGGRILGRSFAAAPAPEILLSGPHGWSAPVRAPEALADAVAGVL